MGRIHCYQPQAQSGSKDRGHGFFSDPQPAVAVYDNYPPFHYSELLLSVKPRFRRMDWLELARIARFAQRNPSVLSEYAVKGKS